MDVKEAAKILGRQGGLATSPTKRKAVTKNAAKARAARKVRQAT
jgi:hypothetical protein